MRLLNAMVFVGLGTALAAASASAQGRPLPVQRPPARAQQGSAGPVTPPPAEQRAERHGGGERWEYGRAPIRYSYLPAMILGGGQVYANFGYGYERVLRECAMAPALPSYGAQQVTPAQPTPPAYSQPEYTQPVPRAQTSSQAMIAQSQGNAAGVPTVSPVMHAGMPTQMADNACWTKAANGRVVVRR
ncbi:MAG TPA: hypothetical protein VFT41_05730 [Gemmatimonadaceae bacterium]|nr:hypothetical protein [Gemmatimonadaceae bacterium]